VYAGWDVIQERNGSNQLLRSFLLSGQSTDGVVAFTNYNATTGAETGSYFYLKDARGNVVALADTSANIVERYVYDPFGVPTRYDASWSPVSTLTAMDNPYYFQSRRYDGESGLYYYRMRYLDPVVGRFITPDPIGAWGDPMNVGNPYSFVGNNPWTYSDPLGLEGDFAPVWHHILPREIFGEFFGDSLDEMGNGYWLPSIFHNAQGVGIHNTIEEFGADWNAQWRYYDDYFWDEWRVDIRTRTDLLRHIAARMSNMP